MSIHRAIKTHALCMVFFFLAVLTGVHGQDTTVLLSSSMFEKSRQEILLCDLEGWMFRQGNDSAWAKKEIDSKNWKRLKPVQLNAGMADENGRFEGWFRLKIKMSDTFKTDQFSIQATRWAAMDVYLDGNHIASFGNTGQGDAYREHQQISVRPVNINLAPTTEHVLAIHLVDQVAPLSNGLKSEDSGGLKNLIRLTGPDYFLTNIDYVLSLYQYLIIWASVCTLLTLLFWMIFLQNREEKNLLLIALAMSAFAINIIFIYYTQGKGNRSFIEYSILKQIGNLAVTGSHVLLLLFIVRIFKRSETKLLKAFLVSYAVLFILDSLIYGSRFQFVFTLILYGVILYYIISSWKNLKGAQWAVVMGLLLTLAFTVAYTVNYSIYKQIIFPYALAYATGIYLSFPISLLVYVSMRFREIIQEVRTNAQQVVKLSEEKKEQALNQKKILEEEVARQTIELRQSLENLKATQSQLIQSEKMASLGELTAGIAHEIQNPLNFVNNFSELNKELLQELDEEIEKGNIEEARSITKDLIDNEERINLHGKRADGIVKSMLQHSRKSSGQRELTDINELCDEYLRLAYHGLCAKEKSFHATFETHLDPALPKLNVEPQEIGRVILNLINNAFYAVNEKSKQHLNDYEPLVIVSTRNVSGIKGNDQSGIEISVKDNGHGIPDHIKEKIFQPFFTTKPTGEGTGLGLSLSYDIIKAHGGSIELQSQTGIGAEFQILLPISYVP